MQALREAEGVLATATALLDISRIEAGIGAEQFTDVELGRLAADVTELYEDQAALDAHLGGPAMAALAGLGDAIESADLQLANPVSVAKGW